MSIVRGRGVLRLANAASREALVTVAGIDDLGVPVGTVRVAVPAGGAVELAASELEKTEFRETLFG